MTSRKARVCLCLLFGLFGWQGAFHAKRSVERLAGVALPAYRAALLDSEEERIRRSLASYDRLGGGPLHLYELHDAIREHASGPGGIFVVPGDNAYLLRALTGLSAFFYPHRLVIARRLPDEEERRFRPGLFVLTMEGPLRDSPQGFKEPIAENALWTLWK